MLVDFHLSGVSSTFSLIGACIVLAVRIVLLYQRCFFVSARIYIFCTLEHVLFSIMILGNLFKNSQSLNLNQLKCYLDDQW